MLLRALYYYYSSIVLLRVLYYHHCSSVLLRALYCYCSSIVLLRVLYYYCSSIVLLRVLYYRYFSIVLLRVQYYLGYFSGLVLYCSQYFTPFTSVINQFPVLVNGFTSQYTKLLLLCMVQSIKLVWYYKVILWNVFYSKWKLILISNNFNFFSYQCFSVLTDKVWQPLQSERIHFGCVSSKW